MLRCYAAQALACWSALEQTRVTVDYLSKPSSLARAPSACYVKSEVKDNRRQKHFGLNY